MDLPGDLAAALQATQRVPRCAPPGRVHRARDTTRQILAVVDAGWSRASVARALGVSPRSIDLRVARARTRAGPPPGLAIPPPPPPRPPGAAERVADVSPTEASRQRGDWMTTADVAALFGVSAATVPRWGATGRLTMAAGPGHRRRFRSAEVHALRTTPAG